MDSKEQFLVISLEDAQKLASYLQKQPWVDVYALMAILLNLKELKRAVETSELPETT